MIRPEAAAFLMRWRGALAAVALAGLGLWWGIGSGGIVAVLGWALVGLGAATGWSEWQRRRFASPGGDPGVVEVVEGRISYFGPAGGGFAALSEVDAILIAERGGHRAWVIRSPGQDDLVIPLGASGAAALFDAFGSLPGLTGGALIAAQGAQTTRGAAGGLPVLRAAAPTARPVWQRPRKALR